MFSKAQVEYVDRSPEDDEQCQGCRHFEVKHPRHCEIVEGAIAPGGYCIMWSNKQRTPYAGISGKEVKS
jgi:hypothetical protein